MNEDKLKVYGDALEDTINQLRQKRTELAAEAKKKLSDYEASLDDLSIQIKDKTNKIKDLDAEFARKLQVAAKQERDLKGHYDALEKDLKDEYTRRNDEVVKAINKLKTERAEFDSYRQAEYEKLDAREKSLASRESSVAWKEKELNDKEGMLDSRTVEEAKKLADRDEEVEAKEKKALDMLNQAQEQKRQADDLLSSAAASKNKVDVILAKESALDEAKAAIDAQFNENVKIRQGLAADRVALLADKSELKKKEKFLKSFEESLTRRENNLKQIESKYL